MRSLLKVKMWGTSLGKSIRGGRSGDIGASPRGVNMRVCANLDRRRRRSCTACIFDRYLSLAVSGFLGSLAYKIRPLVLLECKALRFCLGLPKFVAIRNHAFLLFLKGFTSLAMQTFKNIYASPQRRSQCVFINQSAAFFTHHQCRLCCPQVDLHSHSWIRCK